MAVNKYKTNTGFEFEVNPDVLDDEEIFNLIMKAEEGSPTAMAKLYRLTLGEDQYNKAREFVRDKGGRVRISKLLPLLQECFETIGAPGKN